MPTTTKRKAAKKPAAAKKKQTTKRAAPPPRSETEMVRRYLDALLAPKPRGPLSSPQWIEARLNEVKEGLANDGLGSLERLAMTQKRLDLERQLQVANFNGGRSLDQLEVDFVIVAASYAERKGITYPAWRQVGVPAAVLRKAGINA